MSQDSNQHFEVPAGPCQGCGCDLSTPGTRVWFCRDCGALRCEACHERSPDACACRPTPETIDQALQEAIARRNLN